LTCTTDQIVKRCEAIVIAAKFALEGVVGCCPCELIQIWSERTDSTLGKSDSVESPTVIWVTFGPWTK